MRRGEETKENTPSNNNTAAVQPLHRATSNTATFKNSNVRHEQQPARSSSRPPNPLLRNNQFSRSGGPLDPSAGAGGHSPAPEFTPISGSMPLDVVCSEPGTMLEMFIGGLAKCLLTDIEDQSPKTSLDWVIY